MLCSNTHIDVVAVKPCATYICWIEAGGGVEFKGFSYVTIRLQKKL